MGGVNTEVGTDQGSDFDDALRERLASGVDVARRAVEEFAAAGVGEHLGSTVEADFTTTHRFVSELPGYRGWYWACVLALVPGGDLTVDEIALLPGADALVAPEWVPWDRRIRPGDLGAGDLLPPPEDDDRLVPGYALSGDDELDDLAGPIGLGRPRHLSREGRATAADRWSAERGPDAEIARAAKHHCGSCGFLVPVAGSLGAMFGVCANEFSADGQVVHLGYGCGAHSEVEIPRDTGPAVAEAYDDAAVDVVVLPQQLAATARARAATADDRTAGAAPAGETAEETAPAPETPDRGADPEPPSGV
ncbi:DUF3027 domain-containing protein [Dietzia sp. B32]|uniref:DUF3027 domain-containing protein n=1 Tax=Dietzia sp. B32 TaxID=2915130 RepID=UPI0021AD5A4E|nr:DUF3027 domain-containing protein [Dietzia sp. B32]UVE94961.1 DUF3027 domain-containing protein [Dietzia sp. B32]